MWVKKGIIFNRHHAQLPTIYLSNKGLCIFYSTKNNNNHSTIRKFIVDPDNPFKIIENDKEILSCGERGCFDDSGVMPACVVDCHNHIKLFYSGWNINKGQVPYGHGIGIAISEDEGNSFHRLSNGPIIDRNIFSPYLVNSPFVIKGKIWEMWYCNGIGWEENFPLYNIYHATSSDGVTWMASNSKIIGEPNEAVSRPFIKNDNMWFSYKSKNSSYKIGFAKNINNVWERDDNNEYVLTAYSNGWDSEMVCYPAIWDHYMFYNGNGYGKTGIGFAVWK